MIIMLREKRRFIIIMELDKILNYSVTWIALFNDQIRSRGGNDGDDALKKERNSFISF